MSTRAVIARATGDTWVGTYHHGDSYPTWLGQRLWQLQHTEFRGNTERLLNFLLVKHPGGWSSIGGDIRKPAGWYSTYDFLPARPTEQDYAALPPKCYCHEYQPDGKCRKGGARWNGPCVIHREDDTNCEWAYIFSEASQGMLTIEKRLYDETWAWVATFSLTGDEPDWAAIEDKGVKQYMESKVRCEQQGSN